MKTKYIQLILGLLLFLGAGMLIASMFIPPKGVIDPSVLEGAGTLFTFTSIIEALITNKGFKIVKGDFTFYIGNTDNADNS